MITESTLYWITRLDGFNHLLVALCLMTGAIAIVSLVALCHPESSLTDQSIGKRGISITLPLLFTFVLGLVFLPTTKEMFAIKVIPAIANNEKVQGIGDKALTFANEWLDGLMNKAEDIKSNR